MRREEKIVMCSGSGGRRWLGGVLLLALGLSGLGCAATVIPQLPAPPIVSAKPDAKLRIVVTGGYASSALMSEVQALLAPLGSVEQHVLREGESMEGLCTDGFDLVVRPTPGRQGFASNAEERNTLFIYETLDSG